MSDLLNSVLPLVGVAVGAGLQFMLGRSLETTKQLKMSKAQAYADYFRAVALLATKGRSSEALGLAADAKVRIGIYGSSEVIERLSEMDPVLASENSKTAAVALLTEMRKDIGEASQRVSEQALRSVLFGANK